MVCCPVEEKETALPNNETVLLGSLLDLKDKDISGEVYSVGFDQLLFKKFTYSGTGPDAFFVAGTRSSEPGSGDVVHSFTGKHYGYVDPRMPILPAYTGKDVVLYPATRSLC